MANYPMTHRLLVLDNVDRDLLNQLQAYHELPPSQKMMAALTEAFKLGFKQGHDKASQQERRRKAQGGILVGS